MLQVSKPLQSPTEKEAEKLREQREGETEQRSAERDKDCVRQMCREKKSNNNLGF